MENTKHKNQQNLELISEMISQAKSNISRGGSFQILLWGWVIAVANFTHYTLEVMEFPMPYVVWLITIPAAIISIVYSIRLGRKKTISGHLDHVFGHIWIAVGIGIVILLAFMFKLNFHHNPAIMVLTGIGTYITGILLKFRPVIIGGLVLLIGSAIVFSLPIREQYLMAGIFIILGYLIPGYLLKRTESE